MAAMSYFEKKEAVKKWRETGEIAPGCRGDKDYFSTKGGISSDDLDNICEELNEEWKAADSGLRVGWSAGEFLPGFARQRQLPL